LALRNLLPQTASSIEAVAHKGEEIVFIMEGQVKLYLNDEVLLLNPDDSIKMNVVTSSKVISPFCILISFHGFYDLIHSTVVKNFFIYISSSYMDLNICTYII